MKDDCSWDGWTHEQLLEQIINPILINRSCITFEDKTYVADWDEEKDNHRYSRGWHRRFGPKIIISNRRVYVIDHATLSCRLIARLERWPAASRTISFRGVTSKVSDGPERAIIDRIPKEDLPLLIGSQGPIIEALIERRLKKGC